MADDGKLVNGNNGLPWPVKMVTVVGPLAAIALFLVWFVAMKQGEVLPRIETTLNAHEEATRGLTTSVNRAVDEQHEHGLRIETLLRTLCVNAATTIAERNTCLAVR